MDLGIKGKRALVCASSKGLGRGCAEALAEAGVDLVLNGRGAETLEATAAHIRDTYGVNVVAVAADVATDAGRNALLEAAAGVDILVNNAGIQHVAPVQDFPTGKWDAIIAINLSSAFHTIAAAVTGMREKGYGRIVNIASAHGLTASPYKSAYVAAKHGIVGLTKTIGLETAQEPITCNAVCPGYVLTPLVEAQIPDTMKEYNMSREEVIEKVMLTRQPSKEFATVEQMGGTATFLCSDAAAQITGTTISVDGGWTAL